MRRVAMFLLLVAVSVTWFAFVETDGDLTDAPQDQTSQAEKTSKGEPGAEQSLPAQARETIEAIDAGGPFRYDRDGAVFENRERRLPSHERGYWREYTVDTPGSDDRGARRLVEGRNGELYYTDDHYGSFRRIRGAEGAS